MFRLTIDPTRVPLLSGRGCLFFMIRLFTSSFLRFERTHTMKNTHTRFEYVRGFLSRSEIFWTGCVCVWGEKTVETGKAVSSTVAFGSWFQRRLTHFLAGYACCHSQFDVKVAMALA
uniref:Uncharacterized protein n=1 Tax=Proboscia inermis TaxID=420281 RepID=A0A7S0C0C3_9STRA|mmetsp:Transcript_19870/g.20178  ORF Transcript_19870/g.20178 Transcript_19870/m.20178 type:complete len:117 (+) Transcript_19870:175-525(+)